MSRLPGLRRHGVALVSAGIVLAGCGGDATGPEDRSPTANITAPLDGATFVAGSRVTFRGAGSDPEQGTLPESAFSWSSDLDGELGSGRSVVRDDLSPGDHRVTLTVADDGGNEDTDAISVSVEPNDPPSATIGSPSDGATFGQGAPVELRGSAADPQEGDLTGEALGWWSNLEGGLGTGEEVTRDDLSVGEHEIRLVATDPQGLADTALVEIRVEENGQPSVTIDRPADGASVEEGESVTFEGSATDPEDGDLTGDRLRWSSDLDGELGTGETLVRSDLSPGAHTVTLTATDSRNASTADTVALDVEGDPTASIAAPDDRSLFSEGEAVTFEGSAEDPADGTLTGSSLVWSSDVDGELGTGESLTVSDLSGGAHFVTLTATDSDGNTGTDRVGLLVEAPGFDIRVRFVDGLSDDRERIVRDAVARWEAAVTGDLPHHFPTGDQADACDTGEKGIDDLLVVVRVEDIDGSGGTLARAGPCLARTDASGNFTTPISGIVELDRSDLGNSQLETIVVHEVGHVLGIGIGALEGWGSNRNLADSRDPYFGGSHADSAFREELDGQAYLSDGVPLENIGGAGTAGGHWRELNFETELMTGFLNPGVDNPLSVVSLAALEDIGFETDPGSAEPYGLPMPQAALWEAEADATLSHPASSDENFGVPDGGSVLSERIVVGANDGTWTSDPDDEVLTGLLRLGAPALPSGVSITAARLELSVDRTDTETTGHSVELLRVTDDWTEGSVTWDTRPGLDASPLLTYPFDDGSPSLSSSALLELVRGWSSGTASNHGVAFRAPDAETDPTFSVGYFTRHEANAFLRPRMVVEAEAGAALRGNLVPGEGRAAPGERIDLGDDILRGRLYGVGRDGRVLRVVEIR